MTQDPAAPPSAARRKRLARPARVRLTLRDETAGATPLELPPRRTWPLGLGFLAFFLIFASIAWSVGTQIRGHDVRTVFDLVFVLFELFWILGWSVGVVILGALAALFLFYDESARLQGGRLLIVPRFGPLRCVVEYDLARVHDVRLVSAGGQGQVRIDLDYAEGRVGLGDSMARHEAERIVALLGRARGTRPPAAAPEPAAPAAAPVARPADAAVRASLPRRPLPLHAPSVLALLAANLVPVAGVLAWGWDTGKVLLLYWGESAIVACYTVLRIVVVGQLGALFAVPFFIGHFGAFMAAHFLFVYEIFVKGLAPRPADPPLPEVLAGVFAPMWPALAALAVSHGVSFVVNFLGRREYEGTTVGALMSAPYRRIFLMQVTVIFGGWVVMLLNDPRPALALLVLIKVAGDIASHRREHAAAHAVRPSAAVPVRQGD